MSKIALVCGGARGIGLNIARRLGRDGATVLLGDLAGTVLDEAVARLRSEGVQATAIAGDLSTADGGSAMVEAAVAHGGRIDLLVNNARAGQKSDLLSETADNWDLTQSVMLKAPYFASQRAIASMAATGGGAIVNIASVAAIFVTPGLSPSYHAAKAGLLQMTRYLAALGGPHGVRVNAVIPGFIIQDEHRPRFDAADNEEYRRRAFGAHPLRRVGASDDVAAAVAFLCSDEAGFITGAELVVDGGLTVQDQWAMASSIAS